MFGEFGSTKRVSPTPSNTPCDCNTTLVIFKKVSAKECKCILMPTQMGGFNSRCACASHEFTVDVPSIYEI